MVFALLPYHFHRLPHLFLASYWTVPVYVALALDLGRGGPRMRRLLRERRSALGLGLVVLAASGAGLYYAYFGCFLMLVAALRVALARRSWAPLRLAALPIGLVALGVGAQLAPSVLSQAFEGSTEIGHRLPAESEHFGLKPIQLLLPTRGHVVPALADIAERYATNSPGTNENSTSSLGVLGSLGFVLSVLAAVFARGRARVRELGFYAASMVALGTVGGLGAIFAYLVHPGFRSLNRVSVVIALLALLALARLAQAGLLRVARRRRAPLAWTMVALAVLVASIDQVPIHVIDPAGARAAFVRDRAFFARVERLSRPGEAILVEPFTSFPEGRQLGRRSTYGSYGHLRAYLHARSLRFGFGGARDRASDVLLSGLSWLEPLRRLAIAARLGFRGVLVAKHAYRDRRALEALLSALGAPVVEDEDWVYFRALPAPAPSPFVSHRFGPGFLAYENVAAGGHRGAWAEGDAVLLLAQAERGPLEATLHVRLAANDARRVHVGTAREALRSVALVPRVAVELAIPLRLERGVTRIRFDTSRPPRRPGPDDLRRLTFSVSDVRVTVP